MNELPSSSVPATGGDAAEAIASGGPHFRVEMAHAIALPFAHQPVGAPLRCVIVVHAFHLDIVDDVKRIVANFPTMPDLFITADSDEKGSAIGALLAGTGGQVRVSVRPNRGRDIAPKLHALSQIRDDYDLALCIHSKTSAYLPDGIGWRRSLLDTLAGSNQTVASVTDVFARNPDLGLIFPEHFAPIVDRLSWGDNRVAAGRLARRMGIALYKCRFLDFPSGSMFWCRPQALAPLLDLRLEPEDFAPEQGQMDGTLAHAIERLFLFAVERAGYFWLTARRAAVGDNLADSLAGDELARRLLSARNAGMLGEGRVEPRREVRQTAAMPDIRPVSKNRMNRTRPTRIPENRAAVGLLPMA